MVYHKVKNNLKHKSLTVKFKFPTKLNFGKDCNHGIENRQQYKKI